MVKKITVAKKKVLYRDKCFRLTYRFIIEEESRYGIEVLCVCGNETEREQVYLDTTKEQAYKIARLFAHQTVYPIALKETLADYLS